MRKRHIPRRWFGFAAAAVLAAVLVGGTLPHLLPLLDPNLYRTAVGEQTSISLADGSIVTLNTQSSMRVDYSDAFRVVHLTEGEALFEVAKDASRPFRVISGSAVIQAVGTQFNVRSGAEEVTVTVVQGIVDVSAQRPGSPSGRVARLPDTDETAEAAVAIEPIRLTVGQQARVESLTGQVAVIEVPAVENALAWQQRRLVFEYLSLEAVIDEFNRYNDPVMVIEDAELQNLPISGVFRANDRESFVQFLSQMKLADSQTRNDGTIVLRRTSGER
jgi:transmembrane sensor